MDLRDFGGREVVIDVDTSGEGESSIVGNDDKIMWVQGDVTSNFSRGFPNSTGMLPLSNQELGLVVGDKNKTDKTDIENPNKKKKKKKKNNHKMPSKPPRPPKALSLDASEVKLVREISELAMLKRARMERMERMKALKKMKNAKTSSSSSIWPMIITVLFCVVLFWQGLFSRSSSNSRFEGSPVSSVGNRGGGLISIEYYNNSSGGKSIDSSSRSAPNIVKQISGSDEIEAGGDTSAVAK